MQLFPDLTDEQVKEVLRDQHVNTDKIVSQYTFLFVDTGKQKVLCDMGAGKLGSDKGKLIRNLKLAGIQPEDIDSTFITHAHPDHIGGTLNDEGEPYFYDHFKIRSENT
jgi:metal-dependent hydrolase (beta-lactamase superfamily II)